MVICAGGVPVFADVDKYTITINLENIKKCYTPDVAGILITHNHQINKDIDGIIKFKKDTKDVTFECWPRYVDITKDDASQFLGWPITVSLD